MQSCGKVITSTLHERMEQYGHHVYRNAVNTADGTHFAVIPPGVNRQIFSAKRTALDMVLGDRMKVALKRDITEDRRKLPVVFVTSRLDTVKNHIGVIQAFACSQELRNKANLAIAVRMLDDALHEYSSLTAEESVVMDTIVAAIDEANLWDTVTAFPVNSQAELAATFRILAKRHSVFILASLYEPFGLAPLEAMSCGLPTVVTKNGGLSESVLEEGREFGVLIDPEDPMNIAHGILRILASDDEWHNLSKKGITRVVSKYTWERTADGYLSVISDILKEMEPQTQIEIPLWFSDPSPGNEIPLELLSKLYFG